MTVQTNTNVANFLGNGAATYPIGFKFNSAADLVVQKTVIATGVTTTLTLNSDYSVAGAGVEEGGSITFSQAPTSAESIKVTRVVDLLQLTDLRNQGKFYAEVHEAVFDKLAMIDQQQQTEIDDANAKSDEAVATANAANAKSDQAVAKAAQNLIDMQAQYDAFEQGAALYVIGDYAAGLVISAYNQIFRKDGEFYRAAASLDLPYTLTGNWATESVNFVSVGDDVLRQELANATDPAKGAGLVGYMGRTVAARLGDSVSPQDEGAVGDGVADDLAALDAVAASGQHVHGVTGSRYSVSAPWVIPSESSVDMRGAEIVLPAGDMHAVQVGDGATIPVGVRMSNVRASGPNPQPTNDFAVVNLYKADAAIVTGVEVVDGYSSLALEYGTATGTERRTVNSVLSGAVLRGSYMGLEAFSVAYCAVSDVVATRSGKTRGIQHGLRVTGYGPNHLGMGFDLRNRGNCYGNMVFNNYANGVSLQSGAFGNLLNYAATDCENGLSMPGSAGLDPDQISRSNNHNFAISGCDDGIDITNPISSVYRGTISDCATYGIFSRQPGAGQSRGNIYDLAVTRVPASATFWDSHSHIRLSIKDVVNGATIAGSYNIVDIVADNINYTNATTNPVLTVSGNNNVVRIVADDVKQIFSEVVISGNNNTVDALLDITGSDGKIAVSGTGNIIRGRCIVTAASSANNDYSGVTGWTGRGVAAITTDASGVASIPITAAVATMFAEVGYVGTDADRQIVVRSTTTSAISVKVLTAAGVVVASTAMNVRYAFECYK